MYTVLQGNAHARHRTMLRFSMRSFTMTNVETTSRSNTNRGAFKAFVKNFYSTTVTGSLA
jgi:hypothetical protein